MEIEDEQGTNWPSAHSAITLEPTDLLPEAHYNTLVRAVYNVLSTEIAKVTYAQILDGAPLAEVANDRFSPHFIDPRHPVQHHTSLCSGVMEQIQDFRSSFDPAILRFDARLTHDYARSGVGSTIFKMCLIEMVAAAVHQIAVLIYKLDTSRHKNDGIYCWTPPPITIYGRTLSNMDTYPTLFFTAYYREHENYPDGLADSVGYWAENRILGGVMLFYRGPANPELDHKVFFHSERKDVTRRIYALSNEQKASLLSFLLSASPIESPLPILGDRSNTIRFDPEDATERGYVFRDRWERAPLNPCCVDRAPRTSLDYPEIREQRDALSRAFGDI